MVEVIKPGCEESEDGRGHDGGLLSVASVPCRGQTNGPGARLDSSTVKIARLEPTSLRQPGYFAILYRLLRGCRQLTSHSQTTTRRPEPGGRNSEQAEARLHVLYSQLTQDVRFQKIKDPARERSVEETRLRTERRRARKGGWAEGLRRTMDIGDWNGPATRPAKHPQSASCVN